MTIKYYDQSGQLIMSEATDMSRAEIDAWLNDSNLEQSCDFDQYEIVESK